MYLVIILILYVLIFFFYFVFCYYFFFLFFFSSRRRHTRFLRDWSSDVCSSDLVALHHREGARAHGLLARPVEAEEQRALVEDRRVRRVEVLRLLVAEGARAEADDAPALVGDGEHHAVAEAVVVAVPLLAREDEARRLEGRRRDARAAGRDEEPVPARGREAEAPLLRRRAREPAPLEVRRARGALEVPLEPPARPVARGQRGVLGAGEVRGRRVGPVDLDARVLREHAQRLGELDRLLLHHEGEAVPAAAAGEALPALGLGPDVEGRRALLVERAARGEG